MAGALAARGIRASFGVVSFPRDGRTADGLTSRVRNGGIESRATEPAPTTKATAINHLHQMVTRIAASNITVLILGETGVGKELMAEEVHRLSPRAGKPFLRLSCAALTESLLESELFGHERGAFTGAVQTKRGLLETADGGTVFLDEIGDLPHSVQVKLLRVLEERHVLRVGALKSRPIDVRFVSATNRDLEADIQRGRFERISTSGSMGSRWCPTPARRGSTRSKAWPRRSSSTRTGRWDARTPRPFQPRRSSS